MANTENAFLIAGSRTPIGSFLGGLSSLSAPELGALAIEDCLKKADPNLVVDEVLMGNVLQAGVGQAPARQAALKAGLPSTVACVTINKVCGSGLKTVMLADQAIRAGDSNVLVAGGMESMSNAPFLSATMRKGNKLGDVQFIDAMVFDGLTCAFENCHMGSHAEHIAAKYEVTREDQDRFAEISQQRAEDAQAKNLFADEMMTVTLSSRRGDTVVDSDECVRKGTTLDGLAKLRPVFSKEGTVTAGNASTLSDGAAAVLVVNQETAENHAGGPKARILSSFTSGTEPKDLFIAPAAAIRGAVEKAGLTLNDVDFFEINEAFASQMVACMKELKLDPESVNVNGGGISLGHPIGASGARCLVTLLHVLQQKSARYGVVSLCLGGGNAVAMLIERVE